MTGRQEKLPKESAKRIYTTMAKMIHMTKYIIA